MSLDLTEIQAITDDIWLPGSQDNWSKGNVLMFKLLEKVEMIGSGEKVRAVLTHAKANGGAFGATTLFNTTRKDVINAARFPWAYFYSNVTIDIDDEVEVSGGEADVDMVLTKLDNAQKSIRSTMGDSLWALYATSLTTYGSNTKPFFGLLDLLNQSNTTPKFGGINKADLGTSDQGTNIWLAYENSTALVMNFSTMQVLRRGASVGNEVEDKPDLYVTTPTLKDAFENSLQAAQRHMDPALVKAGFEHILFGASPVVEDDRATASGVAGLNMDHLFLKVHRDFNFVGPVWKEPTNQALKTTQIKWVGAFCTDERRAAGNLTSVS